MFKGVNRLFRVSCMTCLYVEEKRGDERLPCVYFVLLLCTVYYGLCTVCCVLCGAVCAVVCTVRVADAS